MTADEFTKLCTGEGWGEVRPVTYAPDQRPELHVHDFDAMVLIVEGTMTLAGPDGDTPLGPGELCRVPAGTMHAELGGPDGGRGLLATRPADTAS